MLHMRDLLTRWSPQALVWNEGNDPPSPRFLDNGRITHLGGNFGPRNNYLANRLGQRSPFPQTPSQPLCTLPPPSSDAPPPILYLQYKTQALPAPSCTSSRPRSEKLNISKTSTMSSNPCPLRSRFSMTFLWEGAGAGPAFLVCLLVAYLKTSLCKGNLHSPSSIRKRHMTLKRAGPRI